MDINIDKEHGYVSWHNGDNGGINAIRIICGDRSVTIDIPAGIHPQYMLAMDSRATLVAETDEADQYGRYRWNYTIESENKIICKRCLAY